MRQRSKFGSDLRFREGSARLAGRLSHSPPGRAGTLVPAIVVILAAYLVGTIPFGLLIARLVRGVDIRDAGSGNIGATNVGRVLGAKWGILVLLLDALKGALPTVYFPLMADVDGSQRMHVAVACGLAAVLGHMFPCWLKFRGGKGVATALGVVTVLALVPTLVALAVFVASFGLFRIVSLSSILAAVAFGVAGLWKLSPDPFRIESWSLATFSIAVPLLIIVRHRTNIGRLLRGEEPQFRSGRSTSPGQCDQDASEEASPPST